MLFKLKNKFGFSLIETIVAIAILAFVSLTLYSLFSFTLQVIWENKARVGATALANKKLEIAHNLPYNDVGTTTGIPSGSIEAQEEINVNGIIYTVNTQVLYIDDAYDGTEDGDPDDSLATDYKRVRIAVSWPTKLTHVPVIFLSDVAPRGIESEVGGGTLFIQVFNSGGLPVPQTQVQIYNDQIIPIVDINTITDNQGILSLPGATPSVESYQIIASKNGYSTDQTYDTDLDNPSPIPSHQTIFEGRITSISFFIDLTSNMNIHVKDEGDLALGDIPIQIEGLKTKGLDGLGLPIYKYSETHNTTIGGNIVLEDMEWDSYNLTVASTTGWNIAESDPFQPINLVANTTTDIILTLEPQDPHSLRVVVKDINDQPLEDAEIRLYNVSLDETKASGPAGQVFFTPWSEATSTLEVSKDGYENYSDEFFVSGYMVENVIMTIP